MVTETADWEARADELRNQGDLPKRRAEVIALREQGLTHEAIADELEISRVTVTDHVGAYRDDVDASRWLLEHAPDADAV